MKQQYQSSTQNSTKCGNRPLLKYSMPLTEEDWKHLLEWVEKNHSSRMSQPLKEKRHETE